ncbi:MAG: isocitrate/isopropylmalate family dehydrogenase, partial [Gammaproteobacteria bacterium]|nr:isocitrate/isopropylmalate family dehydrogenase [Gammaproteobacteria bacterium]
GQDRANPLAAILSAALMLEYLAEKTGNPGLADAARLIDATVYRGFAENRLQPVEFGGHMGTRALTRELLQML